MKHLTIAVAGSTDRTLRCLQALEAHQDITLHSVITPAPKRVGRRQVLTQNPIHRYAAQASLPTLLLEKTVEELRSPLTKEKNPPDYLLVVDFGYIIPDWLLTWPIRTALNIHPSALPRWRGSSPGQFCLLYGDLKSAVSVIEMTSELDAGPIVAQFPFAVDQTWTQHEYYQHSFELVSQRLPQTVLNHASGTITVVPQPAQSPTPIARRLQKQDTFVRWAAVQSALAPRSQAEEKRSSTITTDPEHVSPLLLEVLQKTNVSVATLIERASRAFRPWPELWTVVPTNQGEKRMKIQQAEVTADGQLALKTVCVEGKSPTSWKNIEQTLILPR